MTDPERATEMEPLHEGRPTAGHGYRDDPRPNVVRHMVIRHGEALQRISVDGEVSEAMFEILETQKVIASGARLTVLPHGGELLAQLIAGQPASKTPPPLG